MWEVHLEHCHEYAAVKRWLQITQVILWRLFKFNLLLK